MHAFYGFNYRANFLMLYNPESLLVGNPHNNVMVFRQYAEWLLMSSVQKSVPDYVLA